MSAHTTLHRTLNRRDALTVGIGSMVGSGVFVVWSPAARVAGPWMMLALAIAGCVAWCNATSSAQLAAQHPESGGTYVYARERLSPAAGHLAGWGFVVGKTASSAAMALTAGTYLWPEHAREIATAIVCLMLVVNLGGLTRTATVTRLLLLVSCLTLLVVILGALVRDPSQVVVATPVHTNARGILQAAGLMFFAFAGYARIATFGEEVQQPKVTIPWAIPRALGAVFLLYFVIGVATLRAVPAGALALTDAPLDLVVASGRLQGLRSLVGIGACIASCGVLLNLLPGVARTVLAMARRNELPNWLARVSSHRQLPVVAEVTVALVVIAIVNLASLRSSIAFSGVTVLAYYALTNLSALRLERDERRWHVGFAWCGLIGCTALALSLPLRVVVTGLVVLGVGAFARVLLRAAHRLR